MTTRSRIKVLLLLVAIAATTLLFALATNTTKPAQAETPPKSSGSPTSGTPTSATPGTPQIAIPDADNLDNCWLAIQPPTPPNGARGPLADVDVIAANDVWAIGGESYLLHWNGSLWSIIQLPGQYPSGISEIEAVSDNDIWLASFDTTTYHWDGTNLTTIPASGGGLFSNNFYALGHNDVWMSVAYACAQIHCITVKHWNGSNWIDSVTKTCPTVCIPVMHVISATDIRLSAQFGPPGFPGWMARWDGTHWIDITDDTIRATGGIYSMASTSASDLWLSTPTGVLHWNGIAWANVSGGTAMTEMAAAAPDDVWGFFGANLYHWDGNSWGHVQNPPSQIDFGGIGVVNPDDVWAVGQSTNPNNYNMGIIHYSPECVPPPTATPTGTPIPPRCPGERFTDVCPSDYFYQHVLDLVNLDIVSGYTSSPPCDNYTHIPCFKPYNFTTRGQIAKIVSNAAGFSEPVGNQLFEDVPPGSPYYDFVSRLTQRQIIIGYPCGGPGEPCGPANLPYFRVNASVSRAQLAKFSALAYGFTDTVTGQTFEDVVPENHFYPFIENLVRRHIINGYECGGAPDVPCIPPLNRPYFRYANTITRGQIAKIINIGRLQYIATPTPTVTSTATPLTHTPTSTPTPPDSTPSPSPTCCTGVTGTIEGSCQDVTYTIHYTIDNACPTAAYANIASYFEVSPNSTGPWQALYVGDCFACPIPPGHSENTSTVFSSALPPGNNWWRYEFFYSGSNCVWSLHLVTDPVAACIPGTITPSPTSTTPTATVTPLYRH